MTALCTLRSASVLSRPAPSQVVGQQLANTPPTMSVAIGTLSAMVRSRSGVDSTLVAEMLRLSPEARLRLNDRTIASVQELRRAFAAKRSDDAAVSTRR